MARKRKPEQPVTTTDNTTSTATVEPIEVEAQDVEPQPEMPVEQSPSFVERFAARSNRPFVPDPYLIAFDNGAGMRLFENKQARVMAIKFDEKPAQPVIDLVKDAGYRWNPKDQVWTHPVRSDSALSTRIDAERLYHEVREMIRQDKDIDAGQEIPF